VAAAALLSIAVTPDSPTIAKGATEQFHAIGMYSDQATQDLTSQVTWASADAGVATISNAAGSQGLATGVGPGMSLISATFVLPNDPTGRGVMGTTTLTVTQGGPTIVGERIVLTYLRHDKEGKPIGEPTVSFVFTFSTPMDPYTAGDVANYEVAWTSTKKVRKQRVTVFHRIPITATYDSFSNSVTLTTDVNPGRFAKGGAITVLATPPGGVISVGHEFLTGTTHFIITPKAGGLIPSV
jgi:hypothetical protein